MLSSRWPRSPSHGKCSKRFCGSSRNYGRGHHPREHEAFACHAFKRNRQEECVQMPVNIARSTPRPSFGLRELLVASHISRLASRDAAKSLLSTLVSESSGECRFNIFASFTTIQPILFGGLRPYLPSGFQERCKIATLHAGFGVIRGMSDRTVQT